MNTLIDSLVRPEIRRLKAYFVPEARGFIKLDAMENPYTWPESLRREWVQVLSRVDVNRYPDPQANALREILREALELPEEMGLILGNGSDELIQMLALLVARPGRTVLSVDPGFVMYRLISRWAGLDYLGIPLKAADFSLDKAALHQALVEHRPALLFLAYPNNPTGNLFESAALERLIEAAPGLVVLDEAYRPFTDQSFLPRLGDWPNLLVMGTLSKMGLAGLRLGFLAGPPDWLAELHKTRLPYNINVLTQVSAAFALKHRAVFAEQTQRIRQERERLFTALAQMQGIQPYPSEANFILLRVQTQPVPRLFASLKTKGILVKNLDGAHPLLEGCLRVTVGRPEENDAFLQALSSSL